MSYNYDRTKQAGSVPSLNQVFADWLKTLCGMLGAKAIPANLKSDKLEVSGSGRNYAEASARGYSLGDLEAVTTISTTIMFQPIVVKAYVSYKDVSMSRQAEQEFSMAYDEDPSKMASEIARWLKDR
jgi:hypothetical protein